MFTGLITAIGRVEAATDGGLRISCTYDATGIEVGASIACDGCCLTVTRAEPGAKGGSLLDLDISNETRARTTLGSWRPGRRINLERPLRLQDELGGHIVQGHVDGVARIMDRHADGGSSRFAIEAPPELARFIAPKGSVTLDGVSLTVNEVEGALFGVNLIPHTLAVTTWDEKRAGDTINLEVDLLARYVARIGDVMRDERTP